MNKRSIDSSEGSYETHKFCTTSHTPTVGRPTMTAIPVSSGALGVKKIESKYHTTHLPHSQSKRASCSALTFTIILSSIGRIIHFPFSLILIYRLAMYTGVYTRYINLHTHLNNLNNAIELFHSQV